MKTVLMVAYHYPPCFGSSGILRTVAFVRHLPAHGWRPVVLTAHPRAYQRVESRNLGCGDVAVERVFAVDATRHLAVRGRTFGALCLPDRWASWWLGAVVAGRRSIRRHRPQAIWSTYPIATAQLIGLTLARWSGLPWIADFRDPMTEEGHPVEPMTRRVWRWIEARAAARAHALVFTTPSARDMYLTRYPALDPGRCHVIANGYDEDDFAALRPGGRRSSRIRLVHNGTIYPEERDPRPLFRALAGLKRDGVLSAETLTVDLRAPGNEGMYADMLRALDVADIVRLLPAMPYREALQDAADADALLLLQAASCNAQIPAKAYEYLRLGRPILALTPTEGDTAVLLREAGGATIVAIDDEIAIRRQVPAFLRSVENNAHAPSDPDVVRRYARASQTAALAACLDGAGESR